MRDSRTVGAARISVALLMACFAVGTTDAARAQQTRGAYTDMRELPAGPVGERITEFLEVINANDPAKAEAFIKERFTSDFRDFVPMEQHLEIMADLYSQSHGMEFYGVRKYEAKTPPEEVVVIARAKLTQAWHGLIMHIEPGPPHRIAGLSFAPARPPSDLPAAKKLNDAEIVAELRAHLDRLAVSDAFSGTVLLAKDGNVMFKQASGLASRRFNVPNKIDTKFNLGSMNKMFTGVAIAQLVERGKLSLEDPLRKYLSTDWLPRDVTDKIRIKHLLTHTSGLGSYFNETYDKSSRALFRALDDYKPLIQGSTLAFEPGTDWQYSNTGMFLLGVVIEKVTGGTYFDYVRQHIYEPAGMINTDCYEMDRPVPNLAIGYSQEKAKGGPVWTNNLYKHVLKGGPAGGGFSTVEDLFRFAEALRGGKLLSPKYADMVTSGKPDWGSPDYGFGFGIGGDPGDRVVGHSGGFSGINSNLDIFLDSGYTAAVMSNQDRGASLVTGKITELIGRRK